MPILQSCQSNENAADENSANTAREQLIKNDKRLGLLLMAMSTAPADFASSLLKGDQKELNERELVRSAEGAKKRLALMLGADLNDDDLQLLFTYGLLTYANGLLQLGRYDDAQSVAAFIFKQPNKSIATYTATLGVDAIASLLRIAEITNKEKQAAALEKLNFNDFQNEQCERLCDTIGWQSLAKDSLENLTERWYLNQFFTSERFTAISKKRPEWFSDIFLVAVKASDKDEIEKKIPVILQMQTFMKENQVAKAAKIAKDVVNHSSGSATCDAEKIYASHVIAIQKRRVQDRAGFLKQQEQLYTLLEKSKCTSADFMMTENEFKEFVVNAKLWLARLYWEHEKNTEADKLTRQALKFTEENRLWDYYFEAVQVLIGRVGFEIYKPEDNIKFLAQIEPLLTKQDLHEFALWSQYRKGLLQYSAGRFGDSLNTFKKIERISSDAGLNAAIYYWQGRAYRALNQKIETQNAMMQTGAVEPLGFYDLLAGQFLQFPSGRTSSAELSPFTVSWNLELDKWISLNPTRPFALFEPIKWIGRKLGIGSQNKIAALSEQANNFSVSLRGNILLVSAMRSVFFKQTFEEFSGLLRDSDSLVARVTKSESQWLKTTYQQKFANGDLFAQNRDQIAWLLYVSGDYMNSITFVGNLRSKLDFNFTPSSFLYFIFYPRPYLGAYTKAANTCKIDIDLLYAISRQESLFQKDVISGAGAVGLMQLLPATAKRTLNKIPEQKGQLENMDLKNPQTNVLAGACYLKELTERYQGNLTYAIAAYNAGEKIVDKWVKNRVMFKDMPFFTEFIPYSETQKYVQRVLRNYYNIKWIYSR